MFIFLTFIDEMRKFFLFFFGLFTFLVTEKNLGNPLTPEARLGNAPLDLSVDSTRLDLTFETLVFDRPCECH